MNLTDILEANKILEQIYLSMFTTAFIVLLYLCRNAVKKSKDISEWLGFYAIGIPVAGYGLWLGAYVNMLFLQSASLAEIPLSLVTAMPLAAAIVNGFAILPITVLVIKTMREEIPKNSKSVTQSWRR